MSVFPNLPNQSNNDIRQAINNTDPQYAKNRVEAMLQSGQLNMKRFQELGKQASEIMRSLGIK